MSITAALNLWHDLEFEQVRTTIARGTLWPLTDTQAARLEAEPHTSTSAHPHSPVAAQAEHGRRAARGRSRSSSSTTQG